MKKLFFTVVAIIYILSCVAVSAQGNYLAQKAEEFNRGNSLSFEENKGQVTGHDANRVKFTVKVQNLKVFLLNDAIAYQFEKINYPEGYEPKLMLDPASTVQERRHQEELMKQVTMETYRMDMLLIGANRYAAITTEQISSDYINYYTHNALNVHSYQKVRYKNIYPDIDWVLFIRNGKVEYEFEIHPGGDPRKIQMQLQWVEESSIDESGNLHMESSMGKIIDQAPESFQNGKRIKSAYVLNDKRLHFEIEGYDPSQTLIIDPVLDWATYYGGAAWDQGQSCATDASGDIYMAGHTLSTNNIASGGYQNILDANGDAFLVKFNAAGIRQWATYYGGAGSDGGTSCAIDVWGNVYLAGYTNSTIGIASGGHQNVYGGGAWDEFLVKFDSSGIRQWATYYGSTQYDARGSCATDASGNVYLGGYTNSTNGIASGGHQNIYGGGDYDAFLVKFNSSGIRQWATYYGGTDLDVAYFCATDISGNIYLCGLTQSLTGIAIGGHQNSYGGGVGVQSDAFLVKFNSSGIRQWATYYGGTADDFAWACTTDAQGNIYLTGQTESLSNIASGGHQNIFGGGDYDAFLAKFDSLGIRQWATYYGGLAEDYGFSCASDVSGNIFLTGWTTSLNNIAAGGYQNVFGGVQDVFLAKFNTLGVRKWATYYGSTLADIDFSCASDVTGNVYIAGATLSSSGIASGGHQNVYGGGGELDAFLVKFGDCIDNTIIVNQTICTGTSFAGYTSSGTYVDTFTSIVGCDSIRTLNLTLVSTIYSSTTQVICEGGNFGGYTVAGTYTDTFTAVGGCDSIRTLNLMVNPVTHTELDTTACYNSIFNWNGITVSTPGDYYFTGTNSINCDSIVHLSVTYTAMPITKDSVLTGCDEIMYSGEVYTNDIEWIDTFKNSNGCDSFYKHVTIRVSETTHDTLHIHICQGGSYNFNGRDFNTSTLTTDAFTNSKGCDSLVTLDLILNPLPSVTLGYEPHLRDILCKGDTVTLIGTGAQDYVYYTNSGDTLGNNSKVRILANENKYFVTGVDEYGCVMQSEVTINAEACCHIMIPNVFSPNGDALNDGFSVETSGHPYNFVLQIYNRWGKKLFISHDPHEKWNGTYNGGKLETGTYYYIVTANCIDGTPFKQKGDVILIR